MSVCVSNSLQLRKTIHSLLFFLFQALSSLTLNIPRDPQLLFFTCHWWCRVLRLWELSPGSREHFPVFVLPGRAEQRGERVLVERKAQRSSCAPSSLRQGSVPMPSPSSALGAGGNWRLELLRSLPCLSMEKILEAFTSPAQVVPGQFSWREASPCGCQRRGGANRGALMFSGFQEDTAGV